MITNNKVFTYSNKHKTQILISMRFFYVLFCLCVCFYMLACYFFLLFWGEEGCKALDPIISTDIF